MASITIDVDLPPDVTITAYQRHGDGHGFEVSWPWPDRCRCDHCRREEDARIEVKDTAQVVRDLDIWGQPSFWVYQTAFHRCPHCHHRQQPAAAVQTPGHELHLPLRAAGAAPCSSAATRRKRPGGWASRRRRSG